MRKKVNPHRKPCSQADADRAYREGCVQGARLVECVMLSTVADKYGSAVDVKDYWKEVQKLCEAVTAGYVSQSDLRRVLKEEYGIELMTGPSGAIASEVMRGG